MRIGEMHLYTRITLLLAIVLDAKCYAGLEGISQEFEVHIEEKGKYQDHGTHTEYKGIFQEHEIHREENGVSQKDEPHIEDNEIFLEHKSYREEKLIQGEERSYYGGGDTIITGDGGVFFNPPSRAFARQDIGPQTYTATILPGADVVQIKINITFLDLVGPVNGSCTNDTLKIKGANPGTKIPVLCGFICNQHLIIDIDNSEGPYQIIIKTSDYAFERTWDFKMKFLYETDKMPRQCLQYHNDSLGIVKSFNFGRSISFTSTLRPQCLNSFVVNSSMALNDQTYSICFDHNEGICGIVFFLWMDLGNELNTARANNNCDNNNHLQLGKHKCCGQRQICKLTVRKKGLIKLTVKTDSNNEMQDGGFWGNYTIQKC